jgi:hypothetical protein
MYDCSYVHQARPDTLSADTLDVEGVLDEEEVTFENI